MLAHGMSWQYWTLPYWIESDTTILIDEKSEGMGKFGFRSFHRTTEIKIGTTSYHNKVYLARFAEGESSMAIVVPKDEYISEVNAETTLIKDMTDEELAARQYQIETEFWKIRAREQAIHAEKQRRDAERKKAQKQEDRAYVNPKIVNDTQVELAAKLAAQLVAMKEMGLPQSAIDEVKKQLEAFGKQVPTLHAEATKKE